MAERGEGDHLLEIGRIVKAHGLRGEVVVDLVTNRLERIAAGQQLTVAPEVSPAGSRAGVVPRQLTIASSRPFQRRHLVCFEGVSTLEQANQLRGNFLLAPPVHDPEALFVHELIGREVVDAEGTSHGLVTAVQANPASDLLVGEAGWLVPLRFVVERRGTQIVVDGPAGLFE
jgi:16S rRNA processing protein RimM